jgi:alpha-amylase
MKKINFAFGIHSHQPVGNFDYVFEDAFKKAYQPFLDIIEEHPAFKINFHYTGILWDWIENHQPAHVHQMKTLVSRGQVELMTGGFYEPILTVIPQEDAVGQIKKLTQWINKHFDRKPNGMWLAERVWEPTLPTIMKKSNVNYAVIDDAHFKYTGLQSHELLGYYITEDAGSLVRIFPISQKLRYTIPFQKPEVTIEYLGDLASDDGKRLIVFADDGEKFGVWPGTHKYVYKKNWLKQFLKLLLNNQEWINLLHFSEAIEKLKPLGRIYLPTASYAEMMHWALPVQAYRDYEAFERYLKQNNKYDEVNVFVRGGFWRNFLSKYPEANLMHKKMLYLSERTRKSGNQKNNAKLKSALDNIWAGQCNCPYWHGVFGGIYLGHIRHAMYEQFLIAEKKIKELENSESKSQIVVKDYDCDGLNEVLIETPKLNLYFSLEKGGHLFELDYLPKNFNLSNTMTRREEGYHLLLKEAANHEQQTGNDSSKNNHEIASIHDMVVMKEKNLDKYLIYDWYERKSLIDHFFGPDVKFPDFLGMNFSERGDFIEQPYKLIENKVSANRTMIFLERKGLVQGENGDDHTVTVRKKILVSNSDSRFDVEYELINSSSMSIKVCFAVEFNYTLLAGNSPNRYYFSEDTKITPNRLVDRGEKKDIKHFGLADDYNHFKVHLRSEKPATVWYCPVETVSQSENGFERVYQNSTILFLYRFELKRLYKVKLRNLIT